MKKSILIAILLLFLIPGLTQSTDETEIRNLLHEQTLSWNKGDIDHFMLGYWNNDSLTFIGKSGVTYGYRPTMANYKKNYSDSSKMGKLFFDILQIKKLSPEYYFVLGKWFLKRSAGDVGGFYTLLFRKIKGQWKIVSDHSS